DADRDQLEMQHARHYCRLAERAEPELTGRAQPGWLRALANDYENLRAAILFAAVEDPSTALRIGAALPIFWYVRGLYREGARRTPGVSPTRSGRLRRSIPSRASSRSLLHQVEKDLRSRGKTATSTA